MTSYSKRNRLSQQNRNAGTVAHPPETDQLIDQLTVADGTKDPVIDDSTMKTQPPSKLSLNLNQPIAHTDAKSQASTSDTSNSQMKNMSKAAVLRHLFFSQISSNSSVATNVNAAANPNAAATAEPTTTNLASSMETN